MIEAGTVARTGCGVERASRLSPNYRDGPLDRQDAGLLMFSIPGQELNRAGYLNVSGHVYIELRVEEQEFRFTA